MFAESFEKISSRKNELVRRTLSLFQEQKAKKEQVMILEGLRLVETALLAGLPEWLFLADDARGENGLKRLRPSLEKASVKDPDKLSEASYAEASLQQEAKVQAADWRERVRLVGSSLFDALARTENSQGVLAVFHHPAYSPLPAQFPASSRLILLERIADPGNLGTIIRTVEALGFDGLIFLGEHVSPYNAKTLRASMGSALFLKLYEADHLAEVKKHLQETRLYTADMSGIPLLDLLTCPQAAEQKQALDQCEAEVQENIPVKCSAQAGVRQRTTEHNSSLRYDEKDCPVSGRNLNPCGFALLLGNEAHGVSEEAKALCDCLISVEMQGEAESLNLAAAAAILSWGLSAAHGFLGE